MVVNRWHQEWVKRRRYILSPSMGHVSRLLTWSRSRSSNACCHCDIPQSLNPTSPGTSTTRSHRAKVYIRSNTLHFWFSQIRKASNLHPATSSAVFIFKPFAETAVTSKSALRGRRKSLPSFTIDNVDKGHPSGRMGYQKGEEASLVRMPGQAFVLTSYCLNV